MAKRILMKSTEIVTLENAFEEFIIHSTIKGLASTTLSYYKENLRYFFKLVEKETLCSEVDNITIQDYILYMQQQQYSKATVATRTRAIRAFFYFCMERGYIPKFKISIPKEEEIIKLTYTNEEISKLLKEPKNKNFSEYRNFAAVSLMLATGARVSTVINIR